MALGLTDVTPATARERVSTRLAGQRAHLLLRKWLRKCLPALLPVLVSVLLPGLALSQTLKIGGTGSSLATMTQLAQAFAKTRPTVQPSVLPSLGSAGGIKAVIAGEIDVGVSGRALKADEIAAGGVPHLFAKTPIAFVTGADNQAEGFTLAEVADIYSGNRTTWPNGKPLRLVMRPSTEASYIPIREFSKSMDAAITVALSKKGYRVAVTDQENGDALQSLPGAFGSMTLGQLTSEKRALKPLKLDGVLPSAQSLAAGRYPYSVATTLVLGPKASPLAREFVNFVRSPAGAKVLFDNSQLPVRE